MIDWHDEKLEKHKLKLNYRERVRESDSRLIVNLNKKECKADRICVSERYRLQKQNYRESERAYVDKI
jgi:hypothetical protein